MNIDLQGYRQKVGMSQTEISRKVSELIHSMGMQLGFVSWQCRLDADELEMG
jgi:hypothetical protein